MTQQIKLMLKVQKNMKIKDIIYQTPEMSEERLLKLIESHLDFLISHPIARRLQIVKRLKDIHKFYNNSELPQKILNEWDLIQDKKSLLTKSQRDCICSLVSVCLIEMTKKDDEKLDEYEEITDGGTDNTNSVEDIQETS